MFIGRKAKEIIKLLKTNPDGWKNDRFNLTYEDRINFWIANGTFGMSITFKLDGGYIYKITLNWFERRAIWKVYINDWKLKNESLNEQGNRQLVDYIKSKVPNSIDFVKS